MAYKITLSLFLLIQISFSDNIDELLQPRLVGNNINYSILVDMEKYIESDKNLDRREIFEKVDSLSDKKIAVLIGNTYDKNKFKNVTTYNTMEDILEDLSKHKIDGAIFDGGVARYIQAFNPEFSYFDDSLGMRFIGFGFQKNDTKYVNEFNDFLIFFRSRLGTRRSDFGYDDESSTFDLQGGNGTINVTFRLSSPPYAYKLNGEIVGTEVLLIYTFAYFYGYKINIIEAKSLPEQIELLKNKTCNLAGGLFPIIDEYRSEINYSNIFRPSTLMMLYRYENSIRGNESNKIYNSLKDFNGENLGSLIDVYYQNLTKSNFPNSNITPIVSFYDIYTALLLNKIQGCLLDKPFVDYFVNRYPNRVTVFPEEFDVNNYGFGFQKNSEGAILLKQFNEFLNKTDIDALYYKWTHTNTKQLSVDTNLNASSEKIINVAINMDFIPLCFYYFNIPKGYEFELVYLFAKEYNYQINFTNLPGDPERMTYLTEGLANITGGHFTITEGRKQTIYFSEPILRSSNIFTVRTDSKKEFLTNIVLDENYEEKPNNNVDFKAKFSNITKNGSCFFPQKFNNTILVNCTIYNITEKNPYYEGFEYQNFSGNIKFMYYTFTSETFFNADKLLSTNNNNSIITEKDKSQPILINDNKGNEDNKDNEDNKNNNASIIYFINKSKKNLSTGVIVAIIIPLVVVLVLVSVIAFKFRGSSAGSSQISYYSDSEIKKI